jgi:hypothetical protein
MRNERAARMEALIQSVKKAFEAGKDTNKGAGTF